MKTSICSILMFLTAAVVHAHPGVGIVQDSRGNVFFTDLKQVWKISPDGKKSVAVPNVHTHELCLDEKDNLYGEHLWYEGDATKKWGHRVWCLKRDGVLSDVFPAREGFLQDYGFVRDRSGNMYWATMGDKAVIKKRSADGKIATHATADFRDVRWLTATPDGIVYLIDGGDLRRIASDGKVTTIASRVSERSPAPAASANRNYQMGLWTDRDGNVYVAVAEESVVLKFAAQGGKPTVAARSKGGWRPSGGTFGRDGSLWLLEYDGRNAVRARHIDRNGDAHVY